MRRGSTRLFCFTQRGDPATSLRVTCPGGRVWVFGFPPPNLPRRSKRVRTGRVAAGEGSRIIAVSRRGCGTCSRCSASNRAVTAVIAGTYIFMGPNPAESGLSVLTVHPARPDLVTPHREWPTEPLAPAPSPPHRERAKPAPLFVPRKALRPGSPAAG